MVNFPKNWAAVLRIGDDTYLRSEEFLSTPWVTSYCVFLDDEDIEKRIEWADGKFEVLFVGVS